MMSVSSRSNNREIGSTYVSLGELFSCNSMHFVPGYDRTVPAGQKPPAIEVPRAILSLIASGRLWHSSRGVRRVD